MLGEKARRVKEGKSLISNSDLSPRDLAELRGTFGTLEFNYGSRRRGQKLFNTALSNPNENTLAQAEWIAPRMGVSFERKQDDILAPYEADARGHFKRGNYRDSLQGAWHWLGYQPYSSSPAIFGSYVASVGLKDDHEAIRMIEKAKISSPDAFLLNNNHAFSLASIDDLKNAISIVNSIKFESLTDIDKATLLATRGLISFRIRNIDEGRNLYRKSIEVFQRIDKKECLALAYLFWAREEARIKQPMKVELIARARELGEKLEMNEVVEYTTVI